jgi:hypothetical protein
MMKNKNLNHGIKEIEGYMLYVGDIKSANENLPR